MAPPKTLVVWILDVSPFQISGVFSGSRPYIVFWDRPGASSTFWGTATWWQKIKSICNIQYMNNEVYCTLYIYCIFILFSFHLSRLVTAVIISQSTQEIAVFWDPGATALPRTDAEADDFARTDLPWDFLRHRDVGAASNWSPILPIDCETYDAKKSPCQVPIACSEFGTHVFVLPKQWPAIFRAG